MQTTEYDIAPAAQTDRMVPWVSEGTTVKGVMTAEEAMEKAGLDWEVEKRDSTYPVFEEVNGIMETVHKPIEGQNTIVRVTDQAPLGTVKGRYEIIQNAKAFEMFDAVFDGDAAKYESVGSLRGGRFIWTVAKLNSNLFIKNRPDDELEKFVLLVSSHDGTHSLKMISLLNRLMCINQLNSAIRSAGRDGNNHYKIKHTKSFGSRIEEAKRALKLSSAYFDKLQDVINMLADTSMDNNEMQEFTKILIPCQDEDDVPTRVENRRNEIYNLFSSGRGNLGVSRWDAYNAVTEYVDHFSNTRGDTSRLESSLLGTGSNLKQRAMDLLVN